MPLLGQGSAQNYGPHTQHRGSPACGQEQWDPGAADDAAPPGDKVEWAWEKELQLCWLIYQNPSTAYPAAVRQ